ncbi:MAG: hypothetical protein AAGD06_10695 [Acidobacteriota bacterium]
MPIRTSTDPSLGIVIHEVTEALRPEEVLAAMERLYGDPNHDTTLPVLWDARRARAALTSFEDMMVMARDGRIHWPTMGTGRTALLTASTADFGMGRMYQLMADGIPRELAVFRSYDEAVGWLRGKGRVP